MFTAWFVALAGLAIAASASLLLLTTFLHQTTAGLRGDIESLRLAEEMEAGLLTYDRTADGPAKAALGRNVERVAEEATHYISSDAERTLLVGVKGRIDDYLGAGPDRSGPAFDVAVAGVRELVAMNVEDTRAMELRSAYWNDIASINGVVLSSALLLGTAAILFWVRNKAFRPAFALKNVIARYGKGEEQLRASEEGPTEFVVIAQGFNSMASRISEQRRDQLTFLAGVAHDLRNPLTALKMSAPLISPARPLPPEARVRQLFMRMYRQVDRLDRMVGDLLEASRIEAGVLELKLAPYDLREPVAAVVELFEPTSPDHEIILSLPSEAVLANVDSVRIEQVLANLVSNAIKYSPRGGRVEVTVSADAEAILSVTDHGIGMSAEERAQLFEPFQRSGASRETIEGVGLGLFVARRIVRAHHGEIEVESVVGKGSTVSVRLPLWNPKRAIVREQQPGLGARSLVREGG